MKKGNPDCAIIAFILAIISFIVPIMAYFTILISIYAFVRISEQKIGGKGIVIAALVVAVLSLIISLI